MRVSVFDGPVTGVVLPVSALRSKESCGVGEFADLIPFADFCEKAGLRLIQLLPVNDTGTESSPYSALSAFALHPLYLRIQDLPEAKKFSAEIKALAMKHEKAGRFDYREIRNDKLQLLRKIYATILRLPGNPGIKCARRPMLKFRRGGTILRTVPAICFMPGCKCVCMNSFPPPRNIAGTKTSR